ncbi:hypothetical protein MCU_00221 [Bartonella elizabethae Re6043vi]|uniref:Uncharacterized protein n=2 Tax=Bartonella elizabethae TaxID=807 RepID=J0ZZ67_BAREL|nr:hypothetical protein [Bartonella elizabethae]EJF84643.1 hypothetical protein MCU_00221 [Bartonella elizabethae Re6043vi]EJF94453.1 hypothetical protein MEE_01350 [Bartonella elizabethae F9251 = ATCC 49927]VEJ41474.1 Uncharacterised protein [Bartonella elizabethae]
MLRIFLLVPIFLYMITIAPITQASPMENSIFHLFEKEILAYSEALQNADANAILNAIPPQIINSLTDKKNLSQSQFRQIMKSQIERLTERYKIESIHINQEKRREGELDNGVLYFVIPVEFVTITNSGQKCSIQTEIIALFDHPQWYFIHGNEEALLNITTEAFPGLEKIKINPLKITKIL